MISLRHRFLGFRPSGSVRRRTVLGFVTVVALLACGARAITQNAEPRDRPANVRVIVDFGDGFQRHYTAIRWDDQMTVLDALQAASKHPRGFETKVRGSGKLAFVQEIDGAANEGGEGRNWVFRVDDRMGEASAGATPLKPGAVVVWSWEASR